MHDSFNLIDEPWIPVLWSDGRVGEVSLTEVIAQAPLIRSISGDVPTQGFAIHRLLLAILHRALRGPNDLEDWTELRGDWPGVTQDVATYLADFSDRFDLFHPAHPFYQVADLHTARDEVFGLERIIVDVPNGHQFFTTRSGAGLAEISAAEGARWVVHAQAFDPSGIKSGAVGDERVKGGRGYPIGVAWTGQLGGVELLGSNLQETLMLNLIVPDAQGIDIKTGETDLPPWERPPLGAAEEELDRPPRGIIDLYTWQSRRVRLVGSPQGVTHVVLTNGDRITPQNKQRAEPMSLWRYSVPQTKKFGHDTYMPKEHDPTRALWRGLSALLPTAQRDESAGSPAPHLQSANLKWLGILRGDGLIGEAAPARVHATGFLYGSNNSVVDELVDDVVEFPADLLAPGNEPLRRTAVDAVADTEEGVKAVGVLARNLAAAAGARETDGFSARAREDAYTRLDAPFRRWLSTISPHEPRADALHRWHAAARTILAAVADEHIADSGSTAWIGRESGGRHIDTGIARVWFTRSLGKALPHAWSTTSSTDSTDQLEESA